MRLQVRPLIATVLALLFAGALHAQSGQTIRGRVVDRNTNEPIPTVSIRITDATGDVSVTGQTNPVGQFSIRVPIAGTYTVTAERIGYSVFTSGPVPVATGATVDVEVRMASATLALDSVDVRVRQTPPFRDARARTFYDRVERGRGVYLTPEQLALRRSTQIPDLLRHMRGMNVDALSERITMGVSAARRCTPTFYINGYRRRLYDRLTDYVARERLWAVEVYTAPEDAPPQFPPDDNENCGVIVIWTLDA
ncbi:carboxypeptidase-like regulatory domain-containing protein [Longimicrobium sp.]|uniref:carboxypeptidase-like regulatory domain-containing protein n=1 Tax=Longimicrobium sp. TaxID=2029185 RepID=UPI002E36E19C|nr:carboxypeptidase-like regulatory domain-containing protein [Longimicrobium sp.]HEX6040796.1 carboxypeptidase-like regulatory domain-containing protein [Longimicrobium sp.]